GVCVNKCSKCTCPTDKPTCNADESCASATPSKCDPATQVQLVDGTCASQCSDGTQVNQCSNSSRGFQCAGVPSNAPTHLELIVACPTCECPGYKSCQGDHTCVNDTGLPESFSWANKDGVNWLSPSKSQGGCGSCWDFAAVAAVEAMYNIEHGAGSSPDLSEQAVLSCSKAGTCNGGDPTSALVYIAKGIVTESCSPYSGIDTTACVDQCGTKHGFSSLRSPSGNLFRFVYENGPVPILTDDGNHAVLMIGWTKEGYINIKDSASCSLGVTGDLSGVYVQPQGTY
ncbi:MAG: hypothetical protein NTY33_01045, partial [Candidatus Moranbacteria bacterium]|nr:hypothetical protein [Candidatus Moranbacteria bacterium]